MPDFARDAENKVALRSQLLTARKSLSEAVRRSASASVQATTLALVRRERPTVCAAYEPIGSEPGGSALPALLAGALPPGGRLIVPILLPSNDLDWAVYSDDLASRVPLGVDVVSEASLIIVPALAVSGSGIRLGRGGGSYDRALARAKSAFTVALLHDGELIGDVPAEAHDRPVDAVITPAEGLRTLNGGLEWTK